MPKIMFRDYSIQHISCLMSVYKELERQGFDCELQYIKIPIREKINEFIQIHKSDPYDLLLTSSITRFTFVASDVTVSEQLRFTKKSREKAIFLSHSVGGGEDNPVYDFGEFKALFLPGNYWMNAFRTYPNTHLIGYPKLDLLMRPERHNIAKELKNKQDFPFDHTVLYAPTLKRYDSFDKTAPYLLEMFKDLDINLIIKVHCDDEDIDHQPKQFTSIKQRIKKMRNVYWVGGSYPDITPLYLTSDVLISGYSGCLREFMLTNRPSIQLTNVFHTPEDFIYKGCIQSSLRHLLAHIQQAITNPKIMEEERQEQIKLFFHKPDGHATERAVTKIKELMDW